MSAATLGTGDHFGEVVVTIPATGMLVFGERHSPMVWGAVGLIFAGVALVNSSQFNRRTRRR